VDIRLLESGIDERARGRAGRSGIEDVEEAAENSEGDGEMDGRGVYWMAAVC
jgi:hypothetical protein